MTDFGEAVQEDGRKWLALAILCVSLLMISLDSTVLNVALPTLVRDIQFMPPRQSCSGSSIHT